MKKLYDYVAEGTYDERYLRLKNCLATHLSKKGEMTLKEAKKTVDSGWAEYTKPHKGFVSPKIRYMMNKTPLPPDLNEGMRKVYRKLRKRKTFIQNMEDVGKEPSAEHLEEFKIIKKIVLENSK